MFYALRRRAGSERQTLVEFAKKSEMQIAITFGQNTYSIVRADAARNWVRRGNEHETGLFVEGSLVLYAPSCPDSGEGFADSIANVV